MKNVVIQSPRKVNYGGASLKFAILDISFRSQSSRPIGSKFSKIHLTGVDIILQKSLYSIN